MSTQLAHPAFESIDNEATDLVIVHREPAFATMLRGRPLVAGRYDDTVTSATAAAVAEAACAALALDVPGMAADVAELAQRFLAEMRESSASLRLEVVQDMTCPKLHIDSVHVRLITTYLGPGTEYCRRNAPDELHQVPLGAIALLQGRRHPTPAGTVPHRSPATTAADPRIVLVIDY